MTESIEDVKHVIEHQDMKDEIIPIENDEPSSSPLSSAPITPARPITKRNTVKRSLANAQQQHSGDSLAEDSGDSSGAAALSPRLIQERNADFIRKLIQWVQRSPILYDHAHRSNRNAEKKIEAWNFIRLKLEYLGDAQDLADFWKLMRDRYTKAKRKSVNNRPTKFQFLKELKFLDPHIADRSAWYEKSITGQSLRVIRTSANRDRHFYIELIKFVMEHPCFYDPNDEYYRRYRVKVDCWNQLITKLSFDGTHHDMYKQWKKLRDRYVREMRKLRLAGRPKCSCKWEFFDAMDWMEPFIEEPRPFEDYEVLVTSDEEREPSPKPIYMDGEKKAVIRLLKPVIKKPRIDDGPPQLELQKPTHEADSSDSFDGRLIDKSPVELQPTESIPMSSTDYYEPVPSSSSALIYTGGPQATVLNASVTSIHEIEPPQTLMHDSKISVPSSNYGGQEVLLTCPPSNSGTLIYGVSKHTDLNVLPSHVRVAVQAQGEEAFDGKDYIFVKS